MTAVAADYAGLQRRVADLRAFEREYRYRLRTLLTEGLTALDPDSGTLTVPRLPACERKALLEWLAGEVIDGHATDWPPHTVSSLLALWAPGSLRDREKAFRAYLDAEELSRQADAGERDIEPELTCPDRQAVARELTAASAEAGLAALVNGTTRGTTG